MRIFVWKNEGTGNFIENVLYSQRCLEIGNKCAGGEIGRRTTLRW